MNERWLPVVGYEDLYGVSSFGRVKRIKEGPNTWPGRVLAHALGGAGYPFVGLWGENGKKQRYIHHLVSEAFIGTIPFGKEVNHKDGNKENNLADNLEYVTHAENLGHAAAAGFMQKGINHYSATLTNNDAETVRDRLREGETGTALANELGVSIATISRIKNKKRRWA